MWVIACGFAHDASAQSALPSQNPFALSRPGVRALAPYTRPEAGLGFGWTNTYNRLGKDLTLDVEVRTFELQSRVPLAALLNTLTGENSAAEEPSRWSLHTALSAHSADGGSLDHFIEEWDRAIGWPNQERERAPSDRFRIRGVTRDGDRFQIDPDQFTLGGAQIEAEYELYRDTSIAASLYGGVRVPLEHNAFAGESVDPLLGARTSWNSDAISVIGGFQVAAFLDRTIGNVEYAPLQAAAYAQGECRILESLAAIVGVSGNSPLLTGIAQYPDFELYTDIGLKVLFDRSEFSILVREDPYKSDDTTDVTLLFGYTILL